MWKWIKRLLKWTFSAIGVLIIALVIFINTSPEFGGDPTDEDIARYQKTGHYQEGEFQNLVETKMDFSFSKMVDIFEDMWEGNTMRVPVMKIPVIEQDSLTLVNTKAQPKLIWFGHSAFLMQLGEKNILFDPMFGDVPSPIPFVAEPRYNNKLPLAIEKLPEIDFIFISHDHYDHLDYGSIELLKHKTKRFYVPIGVGVHLREWGIEESKIVEMNWWDETNADGLDIAFTPSRHFSGRGLTNGKSTLWGSWVVKNEDQNVFFSGDGGYADHFSKIGEKFGPFDIAMVECGQYNLKWKNIHMQPEESAQAAVDLKAKVAIPIHWGAFTLSLHDWYEPAVRIKTEADKLGLKVVTPLIGETIDLRTMNIGYNAWWSPDANL